jgi:hypothetical protein
MLTTAAAQAIMLSGWRQHAYHSYIMSKFKIDSNVPLPTRVRRSSSLEKQYPFKDLDPGQSFFVPKSEAKPTSLQSGISRMNKRTPADGMKFTIRPVTENGVEGSRIWRTDQPS